MPTSTPSEQSRALDSLLPATLLTNDQQDCATAIFESNKLLVMPMGGGKTVVSATAIAELLDQKELTRVLIVTTPKIANTVWIQEFAKWQHTYHVQVATATGDEAQRLQAIKDVTNLVVVITFQQLKWMKDKKLFGLFDGLLIDETTKLKSPGSVGFKSLRHNLKYFKWRVGLTGTPVSEDFDALYAQIFLIDGNGSTLGTRYDLFKQKYFFPTDYKQYNWELRPGSAQAIMKAIAPLVHCAQDYTGELPPITYHEHLLDMPEEIRQPYNELIKHNVSGDIVAANAAVLTGKLQQVAAGFAYTETSEELRLSDYKITACAKLVSSLGEPVLVAYWYQADLRALMQAIPHAQTVTPANLQTQVDRFRRGEIDVLLVHPRSMGHGVQLEKSCRYVVWLAPQWSRDLWEQTNARVWRRGQTKPVHIHTLIAKNSIDQAVSLRVESKEKFEKLFKEHLLG